MTTRQNLSDAVDAVLGSLGGYSHDLDYQVGTVKRARHDAVYEAYVFSIVLDTLINTCTTVAANEAVHDQPKFRFRRGPGNIQDTPDKYSYIEITTKKGDQFELHLDTKVCPLSQRAELEIDVLILKKSEADLRRNAKTGSPKHTKLSLAIEVKFLGKKLHTRYAKEFLGIEAQVRGRSKRKVVVITTNAKATANAEGLLSGIRQRFFGEITPLASHVGNVTGLKSFIANALDQSFR